MDEQNRLAYELHRPRRRRFPTRPVITKFIDDLWEADLVDMQHVSKWNGTFRYILTVIDTFSKFAFAQKLQTKGAEEVKNAFLQILKTTRRSPRNLHTDSGSEFFNKKFQALMKQYNINHYSSHSDYKASTCERFNRTLKTLMYREFTRQNSLEWINILPKLVKTYNNTFHRSIQRKPSSVRKQHEGAILQGMKKREQKQQPKPGLKVHDHVRISKKKGIFEKGYTPNWSEELFKISDIKRTNPITYKVVDLLGEEIAGSFYAHELQKTHIPHYARIEKVLGKKMLIKKLGSV